MPVPLMERPRVHRGCGVRQAGGMYWEASVGGAMAALLDPPIIVDPDRFGLTSVGVRIVAFGGAHHILDIVGDSHYPSVADFVEEMRVYGVSRRIPRTVNVGLLTPASQLLLIHRKAYILNWSDYRPSRDFATYSCMRSIEQHRIGLGMCSAMWWEDFGPGDGTAGWSGDRSINRPMPDGNSYSAQYRPTGITPQYSTAIFARVPLSQIAVVQDRDQPEEIMSYVEGLRSRSQVPIQLVNR